MIGLNVPPILYPFGASSAALSEVVCLAFVLSVAAVYLWLLYEMWNAKRGPHDE